MSYILIKKGLYDFGRLVKEEQVQDIIDSNNDWYASCYFYEDEHFEHFKKHGSVKGLRDLTTDKIWFDLDSERELALSQKDTITIVDRLHKQGVAEKDIVVHFSGNKGFTVEVFLNRRLTKQEVENYCINVIGQGITTLDKSLYDWNQILRIPGTKHQKSKLYKVPLTPEELRSFSVERIKQHAERLSNVVADFDWGTTNIVIPEVVVKKKEEPVFMDIDLARRPQHWKDYKWALLHAVGLKAGERHNALMVLAATMRGMGYTVDLANSFLDTFDEKYQARTNSEPSTEIERILKDVYNPSWQGGQFSFRTNPWLRDYCQRIGINVGEEEKSPTTDIKDAFSMFKEYAKNIDELTVKTGISALDRAMRMTIGMSVNIVGAPSSGKTSLALQILNSMSKTGEQCIFFSYDMYHSLVIQKLIQKHLSLSSEKIFNDFKDGGNESEQLDILKLLEKEYKNVEFCFNTGQTPAEIEETIKYVEEKHGKRVRMIMVDYNELVHTNINDSTQSSAAVAQKLREIAIKYNLCSISLMQPNKMSGGPEKEIHSYVAVKGSSAIQQAASVMLGVSRPGFNPRRPEDDEFITINCLKNRMGSLFSLDLHWEGLTGTVRELLPPERDRLDALRERLANQENEGDNGWD